MIKGIYTAASAMLAGIHKQNLKAHNVANLDTPGFKQVFTTAEEFRRTEVTASQSFLSSESPKLIGSLGLGVATTELQTKFGDGALQLTGHPLDFAIQGMGFFRILTPEGERYTRDGRFLRDSEDQMVTVDGYFVLDDSGGPIQLPSGEFSVDQTGAIRTGNDLVARLGVAEFNDPAAQLERGDGNFFRATGEMQAEPGNSTLHQGYLEQSNVNAVDMMIGFGTYEAAQVFVQVQDELLGRTISTVGKIV